ncbi:hypothetical protein Dimus_033942 [Dionaea muscipula]
MPRSYKKTPSAYSNTSSTIKIFPKGDQPSRYYTKLLSQKICLLPNHPSEELDARAIAGQYFLIAFTYQDYIDAWYYVFLVRPYTYSWFLQFKKENPQEDWNMLVWFIDWWKLFGLTSIIFPTIIQTFYQTFKEAHPAE